MMRELDPAERFIWLLDCISCANFVTIAELKGDPISEEVLRKGLDRLQAKHPLLSARLVEDEDGTVAFYREEGARIPLDVEQRSDGEWHHAIEGEFNAKFDDTSRPMMRCHLQRLPGRSVLSVTFHHAIGDARSGVELLKQLLRFCLRGGENVEPNELPPPVHSLFPDKYRWSDHPDKAENLARQMKEDSLRYGMPAELPFLADAVPDRKPRLESVRLDASQGRALQERCRSEDTTVHGAICAAHLIATNRLFDAPEARTLYLMCPVDMRPHLTQDMGEQLSYCTTFLRSTYRVEDEPDFWSLAREIGADLKHRMQRGDGHLMYASLPLDQIGSTGPAFEAFAASMAQLPAGSNVSNVGRIQPMEDCPEVEAISFALCSLPRHMASLNVTSYRDQLIVNLTFDAAKLAPEHAERLANDLRQLLEEAATLREANTDA
ncbi:MAG: hypothetical protein H6917_14610 [Novosphingobium sp.]|nr:hypothetical protein [Novosphingobium sp.]MCP5403599.1 hypothetical protein [Novosphingobium sp.]